MVWDALGLPFTRNIACPEEIEGDSSPCCRLFQCSLWAMPLDPVKAIAHLDGCWQESFYLVSSCNGSLHFDVWLILMIFP
jgi:hypothetical protein